MQRLRLHFLFCAVVGVLLMSACGEYDTPFILHLKVKNCSNKDQVIQLGHNPNVKMAAADFVIPAGSQKKITWGSQCWECAAFKGCAGVTFKVTSPTNLNLGSPVESDCPSEMGRHEVLVTCDETSCASKLIQGDVAISSVNKEPQC